MRTPNAHEIVKAAAGGNADAEAFLHGFVRRAHWVDDIADGEARHGPERTDAEFGLHPLGTDLARMEAEWLMLLSANPFFLAHRAQLVPVMMLALNAWADSEQRGGNERFILKGLWHEVVYCVAWLTGGWPRLKQVTSDFREYDMEGGIPAPINSTNSTNGQVPITQRL